MEREAGFVRAVLHSMWSLDPTKILMRHELGAVRLADVCLAGPRPHLRIRACVAKGGRSRRVPLWWDAGTLVDLVAWRGERLAQGGRDADPFICSVQAHRRGQSLQRHALRRRFLTACKTLGRDRLRMLTIHHGRHTFISHALAGGRTLAEVRDAAGHSSVLVTSAYLHVAVDDDGAGRRPVPGRVSRLLFVPVIGRYGYWVSQAGVHGATAQESSVS